jgi:hypothetical protein
MRAYARSRMKALLRVGVSSLAEAFANDRKVTSPIVSRKSSHEYLLELHGTSSYVISTTTVSWTSSSTMSTLVPPHNSSLGAVIPYCIQYTPTSSKTFGTSANTCSKRRLSCLQHSQKRETMSLETKQVMGVLSAGSSAKSIQADSLTTHI